MLPAKIATAWGPLESLWKDHIKYWLAKYDPQWPLSMVFAVKGSFSFERLIHWTPVSRKADERRQWKRHTCACERSLAVALEWKAQKIISRKVALSIIPIAHSGNTTMYTANPVSSRMVQIVPLSHKCVGQGVCPPIHDWKRNVQILKEPIANPWRHFSRA